jgi:hypothetical protein
VAGEAFAEQRAECGWAGVAYARVFDGLVNRAQVLEVLYALIHPGLLVEVGAGPSAYGRGAAEEARPWGLFAAYLREVGHETSLLSCVLRVKRVGGGAFTTEVRWPVGLQPMVPGRRVQVRHRPGRPRWVAPV